jgi:uncharacterized protein (DUF1800 family)
MGIGAWLDRQFAVKTSDLPDQPVLTEAGKPNRDLRPVQAAFFRNALSGEDQLRQRVAFALSEIWVVSAVEAPNAYAMPPYWRILRDHAFGNYRDLMKAVTLSPAMGRYLNMANNNRGDPARGTAANENYGRELLQLFTIGLEQLNPDGSPVLDANRNPVPTYSPDVIPEMARALTGWTYPAKPGAAPKNNNPPYYLGAMIAVERNHDTGAKTVLGGATLEAGQTAEQDLDALLDILMRQETMAPFVCRQLIQHLVTSNPSPDYLARVSAVFLDNGSGVRGDLKAVVAAILTDPEARAGDDPDADPAPGFGHLREPVLLLAGLLRGLNGALGETSAIYNRSAQLGQTLFYPPSVFSYFSPEYRTPKGLPGPEFQIYSTQTAALRTNVINALLFGRLDKGTTVDLTPFAKTDMGAMLDSIGAVFLHGAMSDALRQAALEAAQAAATPLARTRAALYVVLTSGEYQVIH